MEIPSDEDAWEEFKSAATTAGEGGEPSPSVVHQQQPGAEKPESAAGGKEDEHASTDTPVAAGPAMPHLAAELREESNVMAVQSSPEPQSPEQRDDGNSGSGFDLLDLLPSPTTAGNNVGRVADNSDLFGSMLASAPENPTHKLSATKSSGFDADAGAPAEAWHQGDPNGGFRGASASSEGEKGDCGESEGEWGGVEQPGQGAAWDNRGADEESESAPIPPTQPLAAEKVDGEWIDLAGSGSGSDRPGEEKEGHATVEDDKDGEGTVAVSGEEHDPHPDAQQQKQQQQPGESLMVDPGCDSESSDLLVVSDAVDSAMDLAAALGVASPSANVLLGVPPGEEPHPSNEGPEEELGPSNEGPVEEAPLEGDSPTLPEPESLAAATPQGAESGLLEDIAGSPAATATAAADESDGPGGSAGVPVAVSAVKPSELEPPLPSVAVAGKARGESDESTVAGAIEVSSHLPAAPGAAGVAALNVLDWGDFGSPASAVEATKVDGDAAAPSESVDRNDQEGQAKEGEEPSHSAAPDAAGVAAADVLDWGDFGGPASAAEATAVDGAAAAPSESVNRSEQGGQAREGEVQDEEEEDGEWSAFEAPPTPSSAQNQEALEPPPRSADGRVYSTDLSPSAAGSVAQERSNNDAPRGSPPPTTATEEGAGEGGSEGSVPPDAREAGDNVGVEDQQTSEAVVPPASAPAVEWGVFGEEETSGPSAEPPVGRADGDDEPPGDEEQAPPRAMPELVGSASGDGSSSWGAFDEGSPTAAVDAPAAAVVPMGDSATESEGIPASAAEGGAAAQAKEHVADESAAPALPSAAAAKENKTQVAVESVAREAEAPPDTVGAKAEVEAVEAGGNSGGDQEPESEDEWGSDFGDFEEAPTTDEPGPGVSTASAAVSPGVAAFPKPPVSAARSMPVVGPVVGAGGAMAATVQGGTPAATAATISGDTRAAADGGTSPSLLAVMVAVFDGAFRGAAAGETVESWKVPSESSRARAEGSSLGSLADLAHLLAHANLPRRRSPARLNEWAKSCILRGIRPVPDALSLDEDDDSDQDAGRSSGGRRRGGGSVRVSFDAQQSSAPAAVPSPRVPPAVLGRSSGAKKASPRVVSPSSAPRPLPSRARAATDPPPTKPVAPPAVLGEGASVKTVSRAVSPSSPPPPLPLGACTIEPPPTEPVAGQPPPPPPAGSDESDNAAVVWSQAGGLGARATATAPATAAIDSEGASAFAAFPTSPEPSNENTAFDEDDFVWSEAAAMTPEMPRNSPPRLPTTPPAGGGENRGLSGSDVDVGASAGGSSGDIEKGVPAAAVGGGGGSGSGDDDGDWSDDPFDSFQSAPPASSLAPSLPPSRLLEGPPLCTTTTAAAAAEKTSSPTLPVEASPWNLDFLMAAPAGGGAGGGRVSPALSEGFGAGVASAGGGGQMGKPLDLVSQALAGFGIASSATPDASRAEGGDDFFSAFSEGGGTMGSPSSSGNIQGRILSGGGGGLKGERERVSSVDVSDLLRATRLRGGGRRASRPAEPLSAAAEARLSALPDLSYMLSQRIRFPMRAAEPLPAAAATSEGFL